MHAKRTRSSAKREVQKERNAKRGDQIVRPTRAQTCERSELCAMRMCPPSGQIFFIQKDQINVYSYIAVIVRSNDYFGKII